MRDILHMTLSELQPGEEIICRGDTFKQKLQERFFEFKRAHPFMRFNLFTDSGLQTIKRLR